MKTNSSQYSSNFLVNDNEEDLFDYYYHKPGSAPGTLGIDPDASPTEIVLIDYNEDHAIRQINLTPEDCIPYLDTESASWIDIGGLGSEDILRRIGQIFHLDPLILEDIVNVPQRPKLENYNQNLLIIAQMVIPKPGDGFWTEQVSLILGQHYLLTVQEEPDRDTLNPVRYRIRDNVGFIRHQGVDYLFYAIWDAIIDGFFPVLEVYGERIEELEDEVIINPSYETLNKIYMVRRELLALRRAIWPQRDILNAIIRDGHPLIKPEVLRCLRDCYDHTIQIMDVVETYRELASGLMDVYLSAVGNKMNEIMKLLTIISTIFIPLTFIAGIYGMNFNTEKSPWNMPELNWYYGYPLCLGLMIGIAGTLFYFFWRRGWFKNLASRRRF